MSVESLNKNIAIQLENWLEKHSRSYPRRWLKRYFRFDGVYLSYSKNDSSKSSEKYKIGISEISDVNIKLCTDGKNILLISLQPRDSSFESELEILMPNPQTLKIWYNSIKGCIDPNFNSKLSSSTSISKSNSSFNTYDNNNKGVEELHLNLNKPLPQPNFHKKSPSAQTGKSTIPEISSLRENKSMDNINKKALNSEKSLVLCKLDALLGDLQHTMVLTETERKSVMVLNNYERIGLSPLSNSLEPSPLKQNCSIDCIDQAENESRSSKDSPLNNKSVIKEIIEEDSKKIKSTSLPPNTNNSNENLTLTSKLNISDPSLSTDKTINNISPKLHLGMNNKKNTIINVVSPLAKENDELISDANKKININLYSDKSGSSSKNNSYVYNMAVNNYVENESAHCRKDSENSENINNKPKSINSSNGIYSPDINKIKQLEVYTQFESSLISSLDISNILIQILDISSDTIDIYYTEYKEVILTKSSDLINKSSSLYKQINEEARLYTNTGLETTLITKNSNMIELGNELASIIRKIVSSLKVYLKIVKKDLLLKSSEHDLTNAEMEISKKTTINDLKIYMNELKNNLLIIKQELENIDISK